MAAIFHARKLFAEKEKGQMRRGKEKKKIQTNNAKHGREESLYPAVGKMDREQEGTEIKNEAIFRGRGGRRETLLLSFLC